MINIPIEFMVCIFSALVATAISVIYYIFDSKRTDEEEVAKKSFMLDTYDVVIQEIIKLRRTTYRRYK